MLPAAHHGTLSPSLGVRGQHQPSPWCGVPGGDRHIGTLMSASVEQEETTELEPPGSGQVAVMHLNFGL